MASTSKISLNDAIAAMEQAYSALSGATDRALAERAHFAALAEATQAELTEQWRAHADQLEMRLTQSESENSFLKEDNLRLSNQLQALQREFLELQRSTGDVIGSLDRSVRQLDLILEH